MKKPNFSALACLLLLVACSPSASSSPTQTAAVVNIEPAPEPEKAPKIWSPPTEGVIKIAAKSLQSAVVDGEQVNIRELSHAFNRTVESRISFRLVVEESGLDRQRIVLAFEKLSARYPRDEDLTSYLAMFRSLRDSEKARPH